jgi:hypothetical protein
MAHEHTDLTAAARAVFQDTLRRRRRTTDDRRALHSRHHSSEPTVTKHA